jgi:hypothetical protein
MIKRKMGIVMREMGLELGMNDDVNRRSNKRKK